MGDWSHINQMGTKELDQSGGWPGRSKQGRTMHVQIITLCHFYGEEESNVFNLADCKNFDLCPVVPISLQIGTLDRAKHSLGLSVFRKVLNESVNSTSLGTDSVHCICTSLIFNHKSTSLQHFGTEKPCRSVSPASLQPEIRAGFWNQLAFETHS